ncbi:MAG: hypothetical protein C4516_03390 [Oxalobacter sp.]|nr:MAG: hypothetical protein C4516_03390 [Oxalobacter sp.]
MKTPIVLTKVSLNYSPVEDRIRMTGQVSESETRVLWLTLRICQKLVGAVLNFVEKASAVPTGSDKELVLSFKQSAAMVRKMPADPVLPQQDTQFSLVERIDVSYRKEQVLLSFFLPDEGVAQFALSIQQARQWLGIVRNQYRQAAWPMEIWPAWIAGAEDKPMSSGHHQVH